MHLTHLGLPVRDLQRSLAFYSSYLGFDPATTVRYEDGTVIVSDADRFDLALHPEEQQPGLSLSTDDNPREIGPLHPFLHFGFRLSAPLDVRELLSRMRGDGVKIVEHHDGPEHVSFKCADPDGHRVEVYWEERPARQSTYR